MSTGPISRLYRSETHQSASVFTPTPTLREYYVMMSVNFVSTCFFINYIFNLKLDSRALKLAMSTLSIFENVSLSWFWSLCQELYIKIQWMFLTLIVSKDTFLMFFLFFSLLNEFLLICYQKPWRISLSCLFVITRYQTNTSNTMLSNIVDIQPKDSGGGGGETRETVVYRLADDMLEKLPQDYIPHEVSRVWCLIKTTLTFIHCLSFIPIHAWV